MRQHCARRHQFLREQIGPRHARCTFRAAVPAADSFYLVSPQNRSDTPAAAALRRWLTEQAVSYPGPPKVHRTRTYQLMGATPPIAAVTSAKLATAPQHF